MTNFDDDDDFIPKPIDPATQKKIDNYIEGKFGPPAEEPESLIDPMLPSEQIKRAKADWQKLNPGIDLIIARAKRDRYKI
jgi:hypothetical protein